jgi:hypothetical protein
MLTYCDHTKIPIEAAMGWFNTFLAPPAVGASAPADLSDGSIDNVRTAIRSGADNPADLQNAPISEEIKRRQTTLIARYVARVRAR